MTGILRGLARNGRGARGRGFAVIDADLNLIAGDARGNHGDGLAIPDQVAEDLTVMPVPSDVLLADDDPADVGVGGGFINIGEGVAGPFAEVERPVGQVQDAVGIGMLAIQRPVEW